MKYLSEHINKVILGVSFKVFSLNSPCLTSCFFCFLLVSFHVRDTRQLSDESLFIYAVLSWHK